MTIHADDELAAAIRKGAEEAGLSISKFIQTTMGSDEGYRELMSVQKDFEVIDEEMWK